VDAAAIVTVAAPVQRRDLEHSRMATKIPDVRVALLGPLRVEVAGRQVALTSGHQRRLLAVLSLAAGGVVSLDRLLATLWADDPPRSAVNSLQSHLARLRNALGHPAILTHQVPGYRLAVDGDAVDAVRFDRLVDEASRAVAPEGRLVRLDQALALWRADELTEFTDGHLAEEMLRLGQRRLDALSARADAALRLGDPDRALSDLRAVLQAEPLREPAVTLLVRALAASGRTPEADAAYQHYRDDLADQLGLDPSAGLQEVHRRLLRGELEALAPVPFSGTGPTMVVAAPARRSVPSRPRAAFVGRDDLLARLDALVATERCVTLIGPGGVGKTRLAVEVAHRTAHDREVLWADLVDAQTAGDVLGRTALAAGTGTPTDLVTLSPLAEQLASFEGLLVLDNCEQVAPEAAEIVDRLLALTDGVRVLATSRTPLHVDAEALVRVPPLATVRADSGRSPALELFLDRAGGDVEPDDPVQLQIAGDVVRRLDGLPLALELAARHVRNLGLVVVRDRLDQRLDLFRAGRQPHHPAHGDLQALVGWSTQRLNDVQRLAFRWLGLFVGSFTAEQAETLLVSAGLDPHQTDSALAHLVEQSLVSRADDDRFRMLQTIRAFALDELEESGESAEAQRRHADAIVAAAEVAGRRMPTRDEAQAVTELHHLTADLQIVGARLAAERDIVSLARLAAAVHLYAYHTQRLELLACARVAVDILGTAGVVEVPEELVIRVLAAAAVEAAGAGQNERAVRLAEGAVARGTQPTMALASALDVLGDIRLAHGDVAAAAAYEQLVQLGEALVEPALAAQGWMGLALIRAFTGDHAASRAAATQVETLAKGLGYPSLSAWAAYVRGEAEAVHDPTAAMAAFEAAIRTARTVDNHLAIGAAATGAAAVRARHGDPIPALLQLRETIERWERSGSGSVQQTVLRNLGVLLARVGSDEPAALLLGAAPSAGLYDTERRRVEQALSAISERLGGPATEQLRLDGARMAHAELVAVALAAVTSATSATELG
jgi:predicted ATPase/DNA-binding SARP family transcriptional activator